MGPLLSKGYENMKMTHTTDDDLTTEQSDDFVDCYVVNNSRNPLPAYKTEQSSGMDLYARLDAGEELTIGPGEIKLVPTGLSCVIPDGFEFQVRPRSGLAFKNGITVLNAPGTIDADYRDDIGIILVNHGKKTFVVKNGDRIAQLVLCVVPKVRWTEVDRLEDVSLINRGGGFGSTGVSTL